MANKLSQKKHLEVSTAAADGADALVGRVASVRGGEPTRIAMSQLQQEESCGKRQSNGKDCGGERRGRSLGVGSGAAKLEFTLLAVNGHATTGGAMLVETRASDTHD